MLRCALRDADGGELVAYLEATRRDPPTPGASVWLGWEPDAARLLHPDAAADAAPEPRELARSAQEAAETGPAPAQESGMRLRSDRSPAAGASDAISHAAQGVAGLPARRVTNALGIDR